MNISTSDTCLATAGPEETEEGEVTQWSTMFALRSRSHSLEEEWRGTQSKWEASTVSGDPVFIESRLSTAVRQDLREHFLLPSADKLDGEAGAVTPAHTVKSPNSWLDEGCITGLDGPAKSPGTLDPTGTLQGWEKAETHRRRKTSAVPEAGGHHARRIDANIHAEEAATKC